METVAPFWNGAQACYERVDLPRLAHRAGGWKQLEEGGAEALLDLGVPRVDVDRWVGAGPLKTAGTVLSLADPRYPQQLVGLPNPPAVLFVEGDPRVLSADAVAVVGTRRCTAYGSSVARTLGGALAAAGLTVVSGLARGVDAQVHRGALRAGSTVAVLAHGLAHTAPKRHRSLREEMVSSGGCVVTTWPDQVEPRPFRFPRRNRWIAGLSRAVVVVEAGLPSGTMHTVAAALTFGREIWAVPGQMGAPASRGCLRLLAEGAHVVTDPSDLVATLTGGVHPEPSGWLAEVLAGLEVDAVARRYGLSVLEVMRDLTKLELEGAVVRLPGRRYARSGRSV